MDLTSYLLHEEPNPSNEEILEQIEDQLEEDTPPSLIDEMHEKISNAYQAGIKLAREHGMQALDRVIEKEKTAFVDQVAGGFIGHHFGKKQVERGEDHSFGGKQIASLLLPGGIGYQLGRAIAHDKKEKKAFIIGGVTGHLASGPNQEASPRSGFWRGAAGDIVGGNIGAALGRAATPNSLGGPLAGALIGSVGGGYLAGRTARATPAELKAHAAKMRTLAEEAEKTAEAEKIAILPALAPLLGGTVARMVGGQVAKKGIQSAVGGMAKDVAKNVVVDKASNAISRATRPPQQAAPQVAPQMAPAAGFKYADGAGGIGKMLGGLGSQAKNFASGLGGKGPGTFGQKLVGGAVRNPGAALIGVGAVGGALMAPRDPVTGEKQYLRGAATGAALGGGAYAMGAGNKLRHAVVSPKGPQIFGEGAGAYARGATKATGPSAARAAGSIPAAAPVAAAPPPTPAPAPAPAAAAPAKPVPAVPAPSQSSVQVDPRLAKEHSKILRNRDAIRNQGTGGGGSASTRGLFGGTNELTVPSGHAVSGEMKAKFAALAMKYANRQTLVYDPSTKSFTRTHQTPSVAAHSQVGGETLADIGVPDIQPGFQEPVRSSAPPRPLARPAATPPPIPAAAMKPKTSPIAGGMGAAIKAAPKPPALPALAGARGLIR